MGTSMFLSGDIAREKVNQQRSRTPDSLPYESHRHSECACNAIVRDAFGGNATQNSGQRLQHARRMQRHMPHAPASQCRECVGDRRGCDDR